MKKFLATLIIFIIFSHQLTASTESMVPVSYKGRFRPLEAYSRLWLYELYHRESIKSSQLDRFELSENAPSELLWKMHFLGHGPWDDSPLFWIHSAKMKALFALPLKEDRFSYNQLRLDEKIPLKLMEELLPYYYFKQYNDPSNRSRASKIELSELSSGLWVSLQNGKMLIAASPEYPPWNTLVPGMVIADNVAAPSDFITGAKRSLAKETTELINAVKDYSRFNGSIPASEADYLLQAKELIGQGMPPKEIALILDTRYPLSQRLREAGEDLKMLPGRSKNGEWYSLRALNLSVFDSSNKKVVPVPNFTQFSDSSFDQIRSDYKKLEYAVKSGDEKNRGMLITALSHSIAQAYSEIAGEPFTLAHGKALSYPTLSQLEAESFYYRYPLIGICIALYALASIVLILSISQEQKMVVNIGIAFLSLAFLLHTFILGLRCYILGRPPVSNMFETVIYVPWIAVIVSIVLARISHTISSEGGQDVASDSLSNDREHCQSDKARAFESEDGVTDCPDSPRQCGKCGLAFIIKNRLVLIASSLTAMTLLIILEMANLNSSLENVQAVLDSQFWLIIHVLMVVGSYGLFALSGVLGHLYLLSRIIKKKETSSMQSLSKLILHSMYLGTALLIPGTILGGVWAAESWGRFWDWDPKESWAFISSCVYVMWIHAYRFNHIGNFGLAVGAVVGLQVISFTWYGVNYILGTGLHSYGFGSGGEIYYYIFLAAETLFLIAAFFLSKKNPDPYFSHKSR